MLGQRLIRNSTQRGDTIVEVLIAVAIVSVILAGAYAITTRNLNITQDTSERNQAQQLAQKQVELLRAYTTGSQQADSPLPTGPTASFCMENSSTYVVTSVGSPASDCQQPSPCAAGGVCYNPIVKEVSTSGNPVYEVTVQWDNLQGATSSVVLDYGPPS